MPLAPKMPRALPLPPPPSPGGAFILAARRCSSFCLGWLDRSILPIGEQCRQRELSASAILHAPGRTRQLAGDERDYITWRV
jgi:hypothetical protein